MKKFLKQLRKDERGLTLVELLAVVVILGIIATIAFVSIGNVIENSKRDAHVSNAMQLISAAKLAEASQGWPEKGYMTEGITFTGSNGFTELNTIEGLTSPWEDESYGGYVTKDDNGYSVTMVGGQLEIKDASESDLSEGRSKFE